MKKSFLLLALLLLGFAVDAEAQEWLPTNGPGGGFNQIVFNAKKDMFLSASTLMRSTNGGKSWKFIAPTGAEKGLKWQISLARNQDIYILGTSYHRSYTLADSSQIWKSTDNGESWNRIWLDNITINYLLISPDNIIYVLGSQGDSIINAFYISNDSGKTWGFNPISVYASDFCEIDKINAQSWIDSNGVIFIKGLINQGLIRSVDKGISWESIYTVNSNSFISLACGEKGNIFMFADNSAYHSYDDGVHWTPIHDSLLKNGGVFSVNPLGNVLFIGINNHAFSTDNGNSWTECKNNYPLLYLGMIIINTDNDSGFYANYYDGNGAAFSNKPCGDWKIPVFPTGVVDDLVAYDNKTIFAGTSVAGKNIWQLKDTSIKWNFDTLTTFGKFVIDSQKNIYVIGGNVYRSNDTGKTWNFISSQLYSGGSVYAAIVHPNGTFFVANDYGVSVSTNNGASWDEMNYVLLKRQVFALAVSRKGILYAGSTFDLNIFRSNDIGKTWIEFAIKDSIDGYVKSLITDMYGNIFANCTTPFSPVYRSSDEGQTWEEFNTGLTCTYIYSMIELPDGGIAAGTDSGVFILPLEGCKWQHYSEGLWTNFIYSLACNAKGELYAGTGGFGVFKSTKTFADTPVVSGNFNVGSINFGSINVGSTLCRDIVIKNTGFAAFTLSSYTVIDPIPFSFTDLSDKKLPVTLNPNDSVVMTICFHPPQTASYVSSIIWNTDIDPSLCGISRETKLQGVAIPQASVEISSPTEIKFSLHPNPSSGNSVMINFSEGLPRAVAISIYDVLGRGVYRNTIEPGLKEFYLPIENLSEGIYYARMELNGRTVTEQFIKMK